MPTSPIPVALGLLAWACCTPVAAQAIASPNTTLAVYDTTTNVLTLPSVKVGTETYTQVTLINTGNFTFTLQGALPQVPAGPGVAVFDAPTGLVTIPAVKVGASTFVDVTLRHLGNYTFDLQGATELPAATLNAVKGLLAQVDALWATEVPRTGEQRMSLSDLCWKHDGRTRAMAVNDVDIDRALSFQKDAYRVGATTSNVQVLALRSKVNPDGSTRQEIEAQYDVLHQDGTLTVGATWTMVSGSSAGTPGCSQPQSSAALRFLGNQRLLSVDVRPRNGRDQRYSASSGAALSPAVNYRRALLWAISDPAGVASHVVVSGPGPTAVVGNLLAPFSLKFISPRLLRSAPELQGKSGNFLNWLDDDFWRYCRVSGSAVPVAALADCVGQGATAFELGITTATPNAAADLSYTHQGWAAGVYRFDVYNDDGWKTVNGHAGKAPIATYYSNLTRLPYSFVEMAGSGVAADKFARLNFAGLSPAQVLSNALSATPAAMNVSWNPPAALSDARRFGMGFGYEYHQGARLGNAAGVFNPAYRWSFSAYPAAIATQNPAWAVNSKPAMQLSKSYFEFTLLHTDRSESQLLSTVSFQ